MTGWRSTIRLRLTALYAGAFFLAGAILIALTYFYLAQSLHSRPAGAQGIVQQFLNERGVRNRPVVDGLFTAIAAQAETERQETLRRVGARCPDQRAVARVGRRDAGARQRHRQHTDSGTEFHKQTGHGTSPPASVFGQR
jgi:hypothetical protein